MARWTTLPCIQVQHLLGELGAISAQYSQKYSKGTYFVGQNVNVGTQGKHMSILGCLLLLQVQARHLFCSPLGRISCSAQQTNFRFEADEQPKLTARKKVGV